MSRRSSNIEPITTPANSDDRAKAIDAAIASIERQFGRGAIMRYGDSEVPRVGSISTGSLGLDIALGIGGLPRGRVVEIYGAEASGKTTLALQTIAQSQRKGGTAAFIDAEHALDPNYARALGVKVDELLISQPDHGEQALEIAETLVRSGAIDVVVVDSVAALVPKSELEGDIGDVQPGAQARLMSQALRKLTGAIHKSDAIVIFINQVREKIGVMFGSPKTTSGGNALKFYASVRMEVTRIGSIKKGEEVMGNRTKVKVTKNKLAPPFRQVEFDIMYGQGVSAEAELVDLGILTGIVRKSGSWFALENDRMGQGKDNACEFLREHPDAAVRVRDHVLGHYGVMVQGASEGDDGDGDGDNVAEA
ncbi:MAG: recombinase RecA [Alphaproteobacteria bacterium]|nr:recombinase RecA [Alphaproteobacteria bacterium]MCB9698891.1 recombinase RecA [Alphaproteobacteria bacterium]